jgi:chaperonin GroES
MNMMADDIEAEAAPAVDPQQFIAFVTGSGNLAADLDPARVGMIGEQVLIDYDLDYASMKPWRERMDNGVKLAKLVKEGKSYPFDRASNIKYPLVTSAALQFNARAYPAIVPSGQMVTARTWGADRDGAKAARSERIAAHMSWQLSNKIEEWEEGTDKLLVQLPIVGTMVRKIWYDTANERPRCRLVDAGCFVVNDKVKSLEDAPRCSELLPLYPAEIKERENTGWFVPNDYGDGETPEDKSSQHMFIEQHCRIDMDGDGYPEPYIVTVHKEARKVARIVADFGPEDVRFKVKPQMTVDPMGMPAQVDVPVGIKAIKRGSYFVAYHFLPSLDGGFHGTGLGLLLGDISESINTIINMMMDAGHMSSLGGGFIGGEFRIKGQSQRFQPGEWKPVGTMGQDIRSAIVPLTFPTPDATLFQLLGMLIEAGREIASVKDIMTGDSGSRQMTATTTIALIEQGMMVFTASYKRIFRALKQEFRLLAKMNAETVSPEEYNAFHDQEQMYDPRVDYGAQDMDVEPVADPRSVTKMQSAAKGQLLMEMATQGLIDPAEAGKRVLEAASIPDIEELAPKPDPMAEPMAQMQMQMMQAQLAGEMANIELTIAKVEQAKADATKTMVDAEAVQSGVQFDAIKLMLEGARDRLRATIGGGGSGVAGQSGNGCNQGMLAAGAQGAGAAFTASLLGGQPYS